MNKNLDVSDQQSLGGLVSLDYTGQHIHSEERQCSGGCWVL